MKIFIKNMACESCKIVVRDALKELDIPVINVALGEIESKDDLTEEQKTNLNKIIKKAGLSLLENPKALIIEKIRQEMVDYVFHSDEKPLMNFSDLVSKKLNLSYGYLANLFSEVEANTIERYIISLKIERIKQLIILEEHTFSEIAYKLHYSSIAHLSGQFKKETGLTPTHFKKLKHKRRMTIQDI